MLGIVDDDTLRRSFDRFQSLGVDQVVLDLQAVPDDDILALLDRYATVLAKLWRRPAGPVRPPWSAQRPPRRRARSPDAPGARK